MSNHKATAINPRTGDIEDATFLDDYYQGSEYGVMFDDGKIYPMYKIEMVDDKHVKGNVSIERFVREIIINNDEPDEIIVDKLIDKIKIENELAEQTRTDEIITLLKDEKKKDGGVAGKSSDVQTIIDDVHRRTIKTIINKIELLFKG